MEKSTSKEHKAYIVTVDMGYGHQRAVYPLADLAASPVSWNEKNGVIITANHYQGIPKKDRRLWESGRSIYEKISRLKNIPIIGPVSFGLMDYLQQIRPFYPIQNEHTPTQQLKQIYGLINKGWGKHLIDELNKKPLPLITSFFTIAFFAEEHNYAGDIYCIATDSDVSRAWAPLDAGKTRIQYLAPTPRVKQRLMRYGVPAQNIIITGFPLPEENLGVEFETLKTSLARRLCSLDPSGVWREKYSHTLENYLGPEHCNIADNHTLSITFAVGGAGAQREIGAQVIKSLKESILQNKVRLNLIAGSRDDVFRFFENACKENGILDHEGLNIIYDTDKYKYFEKFNAALNTTDVLWTKPSELSFYAGLGLPVILCPPVGSQEQFNREWLLSLGAGIDQLDPRFTHEWLFDWVNSGWLAQAAFNGFADAPHRGFNRIVSVIFDGAHEDLKPTQIL